MLKEQGRSLVNRNCKVYTSAKVMEARLTPCLIEQALRLGFWPVALSDKHDAKPGSDPTHLAGNKSTEDSSSYDQHAESCRTYVS